MKAKRLPNGNLLVPMRASTEGTIGDGMLEVRPGTPEYERWLPFVLEESANSLKEISEKAAVVSTHS